jgi:hypothetical protein
MKQPQTPFYLDSTHPNAAGKVEGAEKSKSAWRPIETAPMDGTRFLSFRHNWSETTAVIFWNDSTDEWMPVNGDIWMSHEFWMPLPEPPDHEN